MRPLPRTFPRAFLLAILVGPILVGPALVGPAIAGQARAAGFPVTVESCGKPLTFAAAPRRAVVHDLNMSEILFALDLQPRIAGLTGITGWYETTPEFDKARGDLPELAPKYPTVENLLSVDPDFFFAGWHYGMKPGGEVTPETLAAFGIPVYVLTESCVHVDKDRPDVSLETLYGDVRNIAAIFGVPDRAEALLAGWQARIAEIAKAADGKAPPRVFLYDSGDDKPFTAGRFAMPTALIAAAGGVNIMRDADTSWGRVGWEPVGERDPELIVLLDYGDGGQGLIDFLESHPVMSETVAVRNRRYLPLKYGEITPGPANIAAVEKLSKALFPDAF